MEIPVISLLEELVVGLQAGSLLRLQKDLLVEEEAEVLLVESQYQLKAATVPE
jgi:hypothetical protein